jgi:hypothetical protein
MPTGFVAGTRYYVANLSGSTFNLGTNPDGTAIACTSTGTAVTAQTTPAAMSWFSRVDRPTNEIKEIASVAGNTITFTSPLTITYRASHAAQLTRYSNFSGTHPDRNSVQVTNAGVEDLSLIGGNDGALIFGSAAYSWAKGVEVTQWVGAGIAMGAAFRIEVRDSYLHTGSWPSPGGAGYVLSLSGGASEVLVENNIMLDTCKDMVFRSAGSGSVVAFLARSCVERLAHDRAASHTI